MIDTERLRLRQWRDDDMAPFAALNADPVVMAHFPGVLRRAQSDALALRAARHIEAHGWGLFAVEEKRSAAFVGFVGLNPVGFEARFTPAVEIGWRMARPFWGKGYASEAAEAVLALAFDEVGLEEVVSFTTIANRRSRNVMRRIGMTRNSGNDFIHPDLPADHPLAPHVLYRLKAKDWRAREHK